MNIRAEIIDKWNEVRTPGDVRVIANLAECTPQNVYAALRSGKCSDKLFKIMSDYYAERFNELNNIIDTIKPIL